VSGLVDQIVERQLPLSVIFGRLRGPPSRFHLRRSAAIVDEPLVFSVGIGVQNMSRTYQTTVPNRPEMINIIRTAFDRGVTFYDAAEAYGLHEVERILGEGVAPFRDKVVIATKFGWNIDQETGQRRPGLNSRPSHIKVIVDGMLKRLRTDRVDRVDPTRRYPSKMSLAQLRS
jgi:predicted oxidoreductase